jgi:Viral A-type inclusion protein repeat
MEIEVCPGSIREAEHQEELNALRDRIADLERENAALRSKT